MLLSWFSCFAYKEKYDAETIKQERIKYLPFVWKVSRQKNT